MDDFSNIVPERIKHPSRETHDFLLAQKLGYRFTVPGLIADIGNGIDKSDYASVSGFATKATENGMLTKIGKQWVDGYRRRLVVYELVRKDVKRPGTSRRIPGKIVRGHKHLPEIPKAKPLATWDDVEGPAEPAPAMSFEDLARGAGPARQRPIDRAVDLADELQSILGMIEEYGPAEPVIEDVLAKATKDQLIAELNRRMA